MSQTSPIPNILRKKWERFSYCLDYHKDGLVSAQDFQDLAEKAILEGKVDPGSAQAEDIRSKWEKTFNDLFGPVKNGQPVTYEEVVTSFSTRFEQLRIAVTANFQAIWNMMDPGTGKIQKEIFRQFHGMFNMDANGADLAFDKLELKEKGILEESEFIDYSLKFFLSSDENHSSKHLFGVLP